MVAPEQGSQGEDSFSFVMIGVYYLFACGPHSPADPAGPRQGSQGESLLNLQAQMTETANSSLEGPFYIPRLFWLGVLFTMKLFF